jgi:hypothetical protein
LGAAGNDYQVIVAPQRQIAVKELLKCGLETMVTAMDDQGARRLALKFGIHLIRRHG